MNRTWESADKTVRKDVIKPGIFGKKPTELAFCNIRVANIQLNDTSTDEECLRKFHTDILRGNPDKTVVIGAGCSAVDRQLERAIQMMMVDEKSLVSITVFSEELDQLVKIKVEIMLTKLEPYKPIWQWTPYEKYDIALKYKEIGVNLFKESRHIDAFHKFSKACKILITLEPIQDLELDATLEDNINNLRLVLYNNMAACQLNQKNYEHTIALCNKILKKDKDNVKALYRRGVAHGQSRDIENAVVDLKTVIGLDPQNNAAKEQFLIYNAKLQEANQRFHETIRRMFKA